jgi:hypothetical protein
MGGLFTPPPDVLGGIGEFLLEHGIYSIPMTQYDPPYLYLAKYQVKLLLEGDNGLKIHADHEHHSEILVTLDLSAPDSLSQLLQKLVMRLESIQLRWN